MALWMSAVGRRGFGLPLHMGLAYAEGGWRVASLPPLQRGGVVSDCDVLALLAGHRHCKAYLSLTQVTSASIPDRYNHGVAMTPFPASQSSSLQEDFLVTETVRPACSFGLRSESFTWRGTNVNIPG